MGRCALFYQRKRAKKFRDRHLNGAIPKKYSERKEEQAVEPRNKEGQNSREIRYRFWGRPLLPTRR